MIAWYFIKQEISLFLKILHDKLKKKSKDNKTKVEKSLCEDQK